MNLAENEGEVPDHQEENFMSTLEILEKSLSNVQSDIKTCLETANQSTEDILNQSNGPESTREEDLSKALVPVEERMVEYDLGYSSDRYGLPLQSLICFCWSQTYRLSYNLQFSNTHQFKFAHFGVNNILFAKSLVYFYYK